MSAFLIRRTDTGETFCGLRQAAKSVGGSLTGLDYALKAHKPYKGVWFRVTGSERRKNGVALRCVETGEVFVSVLEAAEKNFMSPSHLRRSMEAGKPACGLHFERIKE